MIKKEEGIKEVREMSDRKKNLMQLASMAG